MITFNERFTAERDKHQWILKEHYMGQAKKGKEPKMQSKESYHGTLRQVCNTVLDRMAGDCGSAKEWVDIKVLQDMKRVITRALYDAKKEGGNEFVDVSQIVD